MVNLLSQILSRKTYVNMIFGLGRFLAGLESKTLSINHNKWHYLDSGDLHKPVVVLLHGFGADKYTWLQYAPHIRKKYRVIIPDLPGFGDSGKDPTLDYSPRAQASRLALLFEALNLDSIHLAGNSMGGLIAIHFALGHPGKLSSLHLINAAGVESKKTSILETVIDEKRNPFRYTTIAEFNELLNLATYKTPWIPKLLKKDMVEKMKNNEEFYNGIFWELADSGYLDNELSRINTPVLVLWGKHDRLVDVSCAQTIKEQIPSAEIVINEFNGHMPMVESPKKSAKHYLRFLAKI
ncbi:MAG: hypothetical protein COA43_00945 [Robiginitomaculum sp.]|nr:MAG: hypothetical protein COA43_00945 [Robiginitomaculum sp.]